MAPCGELRVRRVDEDRDAGYRVLVDRLWPRGVTNAGAALDEWLRDAAPSTELRRWYDHDVARFEAFTCRYRAELQVPPATEAVHPLRHLARTRTVTLLTDTRDVDHTGAHVFHQYLSGPTARSTP